MTACRSKRKNRHYPYSLCDTQSCPSYKQSFPRAKIEEGLEAVLQAMRPSPGPFAMAKAMFIDAWIARLAHALTSQETVKRKLKEVETRIESLSDRIVEASSTSVVKAYEARIEKLEREKFVLAERATSILPTKGRLEESVGHALDFHQSIVIYARIGHWQCARQCCDWPSQSHCDTAAQVAAKHPKRRFHSGCKPGFRRRSVVWWSRGGSNP